MLSVRKVGGCVLVTPYIFFSPLPPIKSLLLPGDQEAPCMIKVLAFHIMFWVPAGRALVWRAEDTPEQIRVAAFTEQTEPHTLVSVGISFHCCPWQITKGTWAVGAFVYRSFWDRKHSLCVFLINVLALLGSVLVSCFTLGLPFHPASTSDQEMLMEALLVWKWFRWSAGEIVLIWIWVQECATGLWWLNIVHKTSQISWRGGDSTQEKLSWEDPQLFLASQVLTLCPNAKCACSEPMWDLHPGASCQENLLFLASHFQERLPSVRLKCVWRGNLVFHVHFRKMCEAKTGSVLPFLFCVWTEPSLW